MRKNLVIAFLITLNLVMTGYIFTPQTKAMGNVIEDINAGLYDQRFISAELDENGVLQLNYNSDASPPPLTLPRITITNVDIGDISVTGMP